MISLSPKMKFSLDGIGLSIFFAALATSGEVFAAAGGGSTIGGGGSGCNSSYSSTWDTCFGGSWRYFRLDTPVPVRANKQMETVTYDMGADRIVIPDASSNTQGGTISRCVADQSTGFFRFGLEVYAPSSNSSLGYQAGLIQKGSIKNAFDGSAQYKATDIPTDPSQMSSFIQNLPHGATFDNNAMHRLFNFVTENGQNDGFSWDDSSLAWFCTGMLEQGGGFASRSNVRIGGGSDYQTTDWVDKSTANAAGTAKSGDVVEITFSHDMKYTGELPNTTVKVEKAWTNTMTPTGASVQIIAPNTGKNPFVPTKKDQSEQVWQSHTYKVTMPTVAAGSTQKVTVCEQITYQDKQLEGGKWTGGESYSKACASITVSESTKTCEELGTCPQACPLPNSSYNIDFGGTQAQSGVVNLTKDGTWKTTDGKSTTPAFVWAKPGDSIQFKHTLCFGAQAVRGNNTDNGKTTVARTQKPSTANTATIKAFTAPSSSGNYLYGKTLTGTNSQTFNLAIGEAKPSQTSGADKSGDYWFTYNSPSIKAGNNAGDTYKCYAADRGFPSFKTNGYQIPDFISTTIPADCASAKKVPTNSDAGKIIEQDLEWNEVKSWLTTQSSGSVSGCGCGDSSASLPSITSVTYGTTSFNSAVGSHKGGCETDGGCGWCNRTTDYSEYDYWYYPFKTESKAGQTQKAQVKIPFNYTTTTKVGTSQSILYGGGEYGVNVTIDINKRPNTDVSTSNYATITKNTVYEVVAFTVAPDTGFTQIAHASKHTLNNPDYNSAGNSSKLACNYYSKGASRCLSVYRSGTTQLNNKGNLNGSVESVFSGDLAVPDAEVGTKFCVAVGVWPSDSHNFTTGAAGSGDTAMDINSGAYWNYSEPSCRTITKKPTVQIYGAGAYTSGSITTSQTKKTVGYDFGQFGSGSNLQSGSVNSGSRRVFGSFTEYETIAKKKIDGFGSGAGFGYGLSNSGNLAGFTALPGGYNSVQYTEEANACTYSTQSFNNDKCSEKVIGTSSINSFDTAILNRLAARYTDTTADPTPGVGSTIDFTKYTTLANGAKYIKVNGNATISASYCMNQGSGSNSNTFIIDVSGSLKINGDIKYGTGSSGSCTYQNYRTIAELPQMLIFASDVNIAGSVTHIDSWLIVGQRGSGSGNINTCSDVTSYEQLDATKCKSQLKINGPVFAKKLILNRTYGAGVGNASIQAAEIFNLRPDAYLWAYNQASRFSQAVTTYSHELAPRY